MNKTIAIAAVVSAFFISACAADAAGNGKQIPVSPEVAAKQEEVLLKNIEDYLNGITNMKSRFLITGADGHTTTGMFYLKRPGRLRFEYDAPVKDYIVADGLFVHYWDDTEKQHTNAPIGTTLADFILRDKIKLSGDVMVTRVEHIRNHVAVTLVRTDDPGTGEMTFVFATEPMKLVKWRITDSMGNITETALTGHEYPTSFDPKLFVFKAPKGYEDKTENR